MFCLQGEIVALFPVGFPLAVVTILQGFLILLVMRRPGSLHSVHSISCWEDKVIKKIGKKKEKKRKASSFSHHKSQPEAKKGKIKTLNTPYPAT